MSDAEFWAFVDRHRADERLSPILIPEPNDVMQNSYLLLDEDMCFLDCSGGGKVPSESILNVGVEAALSQAGFDFEMFNERGGIFNWRKEDRAAVVGDLEVVVGDDLLLLGDLGNNSTAAALVR